MRLSGYLLISYIFFVARASAFSVSGIVTDHQHQPIPFCSVYMKGTTLGTTANADGHYQLEVTAGEYEIVFRSIGFRQSSMRISVTVESKELNVILEPESYQLKEAVVNASAEDPAYAIIRNAIKMRKKYLNEVESYSCRSYVKSTQKLVTFPKKILGQEVDLGDMLDTVSRIFYLSESVANLSFDGPGRVKEEMISSKVSGDNRSFSFNKSADLLLSFYQNLITLGNLTNRGLISPISATAMMYYDYHLEGTFYQNGETVNKIRVIPKRKHDPVFSGDIYILDDSWRIHSLDLFITKDQQIDFLDTLRISENYVPVDKKAWMILNSEFNFEFSAFGFHGKGVILGVFNDYRIRPDFPKHFFDNEVMKINKDANHKDTVYWATERPVPLTPEESKDYIKRDSVFVAHNTPQYMDSIDKKDNKFSFYGFLLNGYAHQNTFRKIEFQVSGLAQNISFNTVEGWVLSCTSRYSFRSRKENANAGSAFVGRVRYGFSNTHLNGNLQFNHSYGGKTFGFYSVTAGTSVNDFNVRFGMPPLVNSLYSLLGKKNYLKIFERRFINVTQYRELFNGITLYTAADYADRIPLVNTTDFAWVNPGREYLSNDPLHPIGNGLGFSRSKSFTVIASVRIKFNQKYISRPEGKAVYPSKLPELSFSYEKAIPDVAGSSVNYDLAMAGVSYSLKMGLFGGINASFGCGKFFRYKKMDLMDYRHFNGNKTIFSNFSLFDFELLDYYMYDTNKEYLQAHGEYNMGGLVLNKIPLIRKLNLNEIIGFHFFRAGYLNSTIVKNYYETSFGIEKFRLLRADFVMGFDNNKKVNAGFVLGLKFNVSRRVIRVDD